MSGAMSPTTPLTTPLLSLDDPACQIPAQAGNKAANLARLRRAGFNVPPGLVVPAPALAGTGAELPESVRAALATVAPQLGAGPWAVRSSATAEDSEQASFAGQFETILNVELAGLAEAVLRCWRSRWSERVAAYGGGREGGAMAVLIQPMIGADAAGVAFTADPVSGRPAVVIESVAGLGERLVSGVATPERWTVELDSSVRAPSEASVLDERQARTIGDLGRQVEQHFGCPQDIEWAIEGGVLWLLQARPITTLPRTRSAHLPIPIEVPPGYWERDTLHQPAPFTPFSMAYWSEGRKAFESVLADFGVLIARVEHAFIGGWLYGQVIPVGAPPPRRGGPPTAPPRWLLGTLMRLHPAIRRRSRAAREAIEADLPMTTIRRWFDEWRPAYQQDAERTLAVDLTSLSDDELAARLEHRLSFAAHPAHFTVAIAYFVLVHELALVCREVLGWNTRRMLTLLEGLSTASSEPARQLAHLAALARATPRISELLAEVDGTTPGRLAEADPEFADAFSRYVEASAHRVVGYDVIDPTLAETPHLLLRVVADHLERASSPSELADQAAKRRNEAEGVAHRLLASRPEADRARFEGALARAREAYPAWEDRVWWTQSVQLALLRYDGLEIGRRLIEREQLASAGDVFFLDADDARAALFDGRDRRHIASVRKAQHVWASANPGPGSYGTRPSGDPPFELLPLHARIVNQAVMWGLGEFYGAPAAETGGGAVAIGTAASAGRYSGTVRVVMGEHEFHKIVPGDVVVCPSTSPVWSIVFPSIGALVTDNGGVLSHPAIIAREHGIPAVVGTGNATDVLEDGQCVTVDGDAGVVELVDGGGDTHDTPERSPEESIPIPIEVPAGLWMRDAFHEPVPLSPFGKVLLTEQVLKVLPGVFAEFGILLERAEATFIGGWIYNRLVPLGAPPPQPGKPPPSPPPRWMMAILMRLHPAVRRRARAADEAIRSDLAYQTIRRWTDEWRPAHQDDVDRALALDLGSLSDEELVAELEHRIAMVAQPAHARVGMAYFVLVYQLAEACRELLGWDLASTLTLVEGLSTTSTEPARRLAQLADIARTKPAVRELLKKVDEKTPRRLTAIDPEFAEAFSDYVRATGHRAVRYDVIEPTLAEVPHVLLGLVADQLEVEFSAEGVAAAAKERRTRAAEEARALLATRSTTERGRFESALARAREAYPAWEDRVWWTQSVQTALLRYLALEIGRRLADRAQLVTADGVFFLEVHEARSALLSGKTVHETARIRRGQRAWAIGNPGPLTYGDPLTDSPPFDLLPPAARLVNEAVMWGFSQFFGAAANNSDGAQIVGTAASGGRYTGSVRVVMDESEFAKIQPGDVVVCPTTSPAWSVVFPSIGALIADSGGILSHPAIIAREHGIPAVVGAGSATALLRDGQYVDVDGDAGTVKLSTSLGEQQAPERRSHLRRSNPVPPS